MTADILKITSSIPVKNKAHNLPKQLPQDIIFDISNANQTVKNRINTENSKEKNPGQSLLKNLNKEILEPLMVSTNIQSDSIKRLVLMARLYQSAPGAISEQFFDQIFIKPQDFLSELLMRDQGGTIFKGEFFDSLRILAKIEGQKNIKNAITAILKYFDCYVNRETSLNSILKVCSSLLPVLPFEDACLLKLNSDKLSSTDNKDYKIIKLYLKNELIPLLGKILKGNQNNNKLYSQVMSIVHNIVRFDKADPKLLEEAVFLLGEELKLLTKLTDEDISEMKKLIFEHGKQARELGASMKDETDLTSLISKSLEKTGSSKLSNIAQNLLFNMVQSESPVMPILHYIIPMHYKDENIYGEFYIDKDCRERKGNAKEARNIYFIIQSDKYGTFEVDLLARDRTIDLEINSKEQWIGILRETRQKFKQIIEEQGYRLLHYQVGEYKEGKSILQKFPKLGLRKVGLDVKI